MALELSRQRTRQHALNQFRYIKTCVLARELCLLVRTHRATFDTKDVNECCSFISNLCNEAGCDEPSSICAKAAEAVMENEEAYLQLCGQSCKKCGESRQPSRPLPTPAPERSVYVA